MAIKFSDIRDAFDYVSHGEALEHAAYISRATGTIHFHSEYGDNFEELPEDIEDTTAYIALPGKRDLDLGHRLAIRFASDHVPDLYGEVRGIFHRRGAYTRFKGLLNERGVLQQWYDYEEQAIDAALREWCSEEGIETKD